MKNLLKPVMAAAVTAALANGCSAAQSDSIISSVTSVLSTYEQALNQADTNTIMSLYAADGVFMPQHSMPSTGSDAIEVAYNAVFNTIKLEIEFTVDEVTPISNDWAFARTRSQGYVTILANDMRVPEANQELFLFHREQSGDWKIARYIFSTTNPQRQ